MNVLSFHFDRTTGEFSGLHLPPTILLAHYDNRCIIDTKQTQTIDSSIVQNDSFALLAVEERVRTTLHDSFWP